MRLNFLKLAKLTGVANGLAARSSFSPKDFASDFRLVVAGVECFWTQCRPR